MDAAAAPRKRFDLVAYLKLFRFPLVFTAIADSATGYLVVSYRSFDFWVLGLLALASSGLYFFGMALNDIADLDRDRELSPSRILPSGRITRRNAVYAALIALAFSFEAVILLGLTGLFWQLIIPWLIAVAAILSYDLHWLKVAPMMGIVRSSNLMLGLCVGEGIGSVSSELAPWKCLVYAVPEFVYVTALTYVSTLEDEEIDRSRLWVGAWAMIVAAFLASSILPVLGLGGDYFNYSPSAWRGKVGGLDIRLGSVHWPAIDTALLLVVWIFYRAWTARDRHGVMLLVRDGIAGIILLNGALLISRVHDPEMGLALKALLIPTIISVAIFKKLA